MRVKVKVNSPFPALNHFRTDTLIAPHSVAFSSDTQQSFTSNARVLDPSGVSRTCPLEERNLNPVLRVSTDLLLWGMAPFSNSLRPMARFRRGSRADHDPAVETRVKNSVLDRLLQAVTDGRGG